MRVYTVWQVRQHMKEALDWADTGEEVVITRWDKVYILKVPFNKDQYRVVKDKRVVKGFRDGADNKDERGCSEIFKS